MPASSIDQCSFVIVPPVPSPFSPAIAGISLLPALFLRHGTQEQPTMLLIKEQKPQLIILLLAGRRRRNILPVNRKIMDYTKSAKGPWKRSRAIRYKKTRQITLYRTHRSKFLNIPSKQSTNPFARSAGHPVIHHTALFFSFG